MKRNGPDIVNSMDPISLKQLIEGSIELAKMRGGKKEAVKEEQVTIDFAFATVVTIQAIRMGERLTKENIWVKRPGIGEIKADSYNDIIGKVVNKDVEIDKHLSWSDLSK